MERSTALVVDAGPLLAVADRDAADHDRCLALLESFTGPLLVPVLTVAEVTHLMAARLHPDAELRFLTDLGLGNLIVEPVHASDWLRIAELVERYGDLPLGTVDASVVAAAERLGLTTIATLDRRHFSVVRPKHVDSFELLP
ncbi:MAG: PIN domain-containing protein [Actinobacteria bacterium]|nr:PIN domain-containing protein [Actinomycetota bacterium]